MGFDLYGRNKTDETGKYFHNNVCWWRPLAEYVLEHVELPEKETVYWQSNDGQKVSAKSARQIADVLDAHIADGSAAEYVKARDAALAAMPDLPCRYCNATGERHDQYVDGKCNVCHGKKTVRPAETDYPLDVENIAEFAKFCRASGGFRIW